MFIDESEGLERLRDPRNVLSRVQREDRTELPAALPELIIPSIPSLEELADDAADTENFDPLKAAQSGADFDPFAALHIGRLTTPNKPGRKVGIRQRTTEENAAVAVTSLMLGSTATESLFGVRPAQQHVLTDGFTSTVDHGKKKPKEALLEEIHRQGGSIVKKAFGRIDAVLDRMTDAKLDSVGKATDLAQIASGMSKIIQNLTPKDSGADEGGVHFHVYRPEQANISDYEMVVVGASRTESAAATPNS